VLASLGAGEYPVFKPSSMVATLGAPVARSELDDELGLGGRALAMVATLWAALGDGWSRADMIGAHLDAALDEAAATPGGTREVAATLERIGAAMCSGRDASAERAQLRARIAARAKSHPDESPALLATADALAQGCR
jgi:hypothetical protein